MLLIRCKVFSKLGMGSLCLMSFILFCSVFTSENAFSQYWNKENLVVNYNQKEKFIIFDFLFYDFNSNVSQRHSFVKTFDFHYHEEGKGDFLLMNARTYEQKELRDCAWIKMSSKKNNEKIYLFDNFNRNSGAKWSDANKEITVQVKFRNVRDVDVKSKKFYMRVRWDLPESCKRITHIKLQGQWVVNRGISDFVNDVYSLDQVKLNSNAPSELESGISDKVKVTGESDTIIITGAEPGENITVYTVSGVEVKSIVANDDVVNIKLPNNQLYLVKAGHACCKIAL